MDSVVVSFLLTLNSYLSNGNSGNASLCYLNAAIATQQGERKDFFKVPVKYFSLKQQFLVSFWFVIQLNF